MRRSLIVYCAISGYGQTGPKRDASGHDMNYLGLIGLLGLTGERGGEPVQAAGQIADLGGGALMAAFGIMAALRERDGSGRAGFESPGSGEGQVVDAAMVDGSASLMTIIYSFHAFGIWGEERASNMLDTGAPFYEVYETSDGKYFACGGIEAKFYAELLEGMGLTGDPDLPGQMERDKSFS